MSMLGLRDFVVVAPASSFQQHTAENVFSDHHHHHHHHHISGNSATALGIGVGVFPLLAAAPCVMEGGGGGRGHGGGGVVVGDEEEEEGLGVMGTVSCTDCGNKAKRDCKFRRCRTCCKSRGYQCHTHVKSTWVPAARRRERQLMMAGTCTAGGGGGGTSTDSSSGEAKRARVVVVGGSHSHNNTALSHNSVSNASKSLDTSSIQQDGGMKEREEVVLPGQVKAKGVFRCVRVTAMEEGGEDEYAYQAMVKIGGHVFKGFLYDQGSEQKNIISSSELHLHTHTDPHHPHQRDFSSSSPLPTTHHPPPTPFHPTPHPGLLVFGGAG